MKSKKQSWADLPPDLLSLILSRLTVVDSTTFNAVCRSWQSMIPKVRNFFSAATDIPFSESSCLLSLYGSLCEFYHPVYNATYHQNIPELSGTHIRSSNFGWLLVDNGSHLFFFNPFTKDKIDLPYINLYFVTKFHFSASPTSPNCNVIGLAPWNWAPGVFIIKHGESKWKLIEFANDDMRYLSPCRCSPTFFNGKYYFLGNTCNIGVFVFDVEKESLEIHDGAYNNSYRIFPRALLVEEKDDGSPESLLMVFTRYDSFEYCNVARFNLSKMIWEKVENLGSDKMLYLSDDGVSYLETSVSREMGNKIYFPKFHNNNGVFYSLARRKFHSFDGSYSSGVPIKLLKPPQCTWIKPSYTKASVEKLRWCKRSTRQELN